MTIAAKMTASQINRELDKLDFKNSELIAEFIAAGRGNERAQETLAMTDPLALRYKALEERRNELHAEIVARYGFNAPQRLPLRQGFGPRLRS